MDWADDIAYSVHDLDDFYRVGIIPLDRLLTGSGDERKRFLNGVRARWERDGRQDDLNDWDDMAIAFDELANRILLAHSYLVHPYTGARDQRADLRSLTASLIRRYVVEDAITLRDPAPPIHKSVTITREYELEVKILKQLTWQYVIENPALATQQYGQVRMIEELFEILHDSASDGQFNIFPPRFSERLEEDYSDRHITRTVADYISGMTERQTIELHQRLTGASPGSISDSLTP